MPRTMRWIETGRTLAMLFVVVWHSIQLATTENVGSAAWTRVTGGFLTFAVPVFLIISGYLMQLSLASGQQPWKKFGIHKLRRIGFPLLVWSAIYIVLSNLLLGWPLLTWNNLWLLFTGYIHLWYLFVLLQLLFLHNWLVPQIRKYGAGRILLIAASISGVFYLFSSLLLVWTGNDHHWFEWHLGKFFPGWAVFYFWGIYLAAVPSVMPRLQRHTLWLFLLVLASFSLFYTALSHEVETYGDFVRLYFLISGLPFQLAASTLVLVLCRKWEERAGKLFILSAETGRDTFGIYLIHVVYIYILGLLWSGLGLTKGPFISTLTAIAVWYASIYTVRFCRNRHIPIPL